MKRVLIIAALLSVVSCLCISLNAQNYVQEGTNFKQVKSEKSVKVNPGKETKYTWTFTNGEEYPIWISPKGKAYVNKVSKKTGKEYRVYLDSTVAVKILNSKGL